MKQQGYEKKRSDGLEDFLSTLPRGTSEDEERYGLVRAFVTRFEAFYFKDIPIEQKTAMELKGLLDEIRRLKKRR